MLCKQRIPPIAMKLTRTILFILLFAVGLQACRHAANGDSGDNNDTVTDTAVSATTAPPDTIGPKINLVIDKEDSLFVMNTAADNLAEIELGNLAIKNAKGKRVKNFGWLMVKEHDKANEKLIVLAATKKLTLPTKQGSAEQQLMMRLGKKQGGDFDRAYITIMMDDHKRDVKEFTEASIKTQDPEIKAYAKKMLPVVQKHLDAINAIHDSMSQ
jgi:putative membrane protein